MIALCLPKWLPCFLLCLLLSAVPGFAQQNAPDFYPEWAHKVGARKQVFDKAVFWVNRFGADSTGGRVTTSAIQAAIDACAKAGGGTVQFQPGTYLAGAIFLKKNVHLVIGKGVLIKGSQDFDDYPEIDTRIAGIEMRWPAALINVISVQGVAVSGEGKVDAQGKFCWDKYWAMRRDYEARGLRWIVDYDAKRVRTFLVQNAENVQLKGLTFANAGFWTVQILYSKYITVDGVTIRNNEDGHGPSTDGIDIDSSSWVLVQNCDIDCNDDDFCLKAGRDWDGLRVARPTEYVVIRNSIARKGSGLLTMGSETSGGIRHVLAHDLVGKGTSNGLHIKSATTRGGVVEDIHFINITMDSVRTAFQFTMNWNPAYSYSKLPDGINPDSVPVHWKTLLRKVEPAERGLPKFRNVVVRNVQATNSNKAINAQGLEQSMLENFKFFNSSVTAQDAGDIGYAKGWTFSGVSIKGSAKKELTIAHASGMKGVETMIAEK